MTRTKIAFVVVIWLLCSMGTALAAPATSITSYEWRPHIALDASLWTATENHPEGVRTFGWQTLSLRDGRLFGIGTADKGQRTVAFIYDHSKKLWSETGAVPDGVYALTRSATLLPNGVVFLLGIDADKKLQTMLFDPATEQWSLTSPPPRQDINRFETYELVASGNVLVLGLAATTEGWIYNYKKNDWSLTGPIPYAASHVNHIETLANGDLLVIGEDLSIYSRWFAVRYSPERNLWTETGKMPVLMSGTSSAFTEFGDGLILAVGYRDSPVGIVGLIYRPKTDSWKATSSVPEGITGISQIKTLHDGTVLAVATNARKYGVSILSYDPKSDNWKMGDQPEQTPGVAYSYIHLMSESGDGLWAVGRKSNIVSDELAYSIFHKKWSKVRQLPDGYMGSSPVFSDGSSLLFLGPNTGIGSPLEWSVIFKP